MPSAATRRELRIALSAAGVLAIIAAAAALILTVVNVRDFVDTASAERERELVRHVVDRQFDGRPFTVMEAAELARTLALRGARLANVPAQPAAGEVAIEISDVNSLVWAPRRMGEEALRNFAPVRVPFILGWIIVVGLLLWKVARLAGRLDAERATEALQAREDVLTGLLNRRGFMEALQGACDGGRAFGLISLDLDGFKQVNDTHGHDAGDLLLKVLGRRLAAALGPDDIVARLGGDEFAIIARGGSAPVSRLADKLVLRMGEPVRLADETVTVGASAGVASMPGDAVEADKLMRLADRALYKAKATGGGVREATMFPPEDTLAA